MNRREFLQTGSLGGILTVSGGAAACGVRGPDDSGPGPFELDELTITELQQGMAEGRLSARSITELYLSRIDEIDRQGPGLRAIIETNPDALKIAGDLDRERKLKGPRGPLHGIPVVLKDNIDTADRMTTTAGSLALEGSIPKEDAFLARRLRELGAVLLAKANLSEWANFRSNRSSSGWSGRGGQCRNPFILDRNPCGSSSGSAVAVSANLCAVSIGTETDGSIVCPSNANGVVGIKPTLGLVSRSGIIPIAHSQDTAGPIARTVTDAVTLLGALTGVDSKDEATSASLTNLKADYREFLNPDGLRGARIGIARQYFGFHEEVDKCMEAAIEAMRQGGAEIVDPTDIATHGQLGDSEMEVLLYEFKADLNAYLEDLGETAPVRSLQEIIDFNELNHDREMPFFGQEIFLQAQEKGPLTSEDYRSALEKNRRLTRAEGIDKTMEEHQLDAIIAPTGGPAWVTDLINGDHFGGGSSGIAAIAGYPSITVPAGQIYGLPVGLSFFGRAWSEPKLIQIAYGFEQATLARVRPEFLPTFSAEPVLQGSRRDG